MRSKDFMKTTRLALALTIMLIAPLAASADGFLTNFVKDSLQITGDAVGGTLGVVGGTVNAVGNVVSGAVDSAGNVVDRSGRIVGRVITPDQLPARGVTTYGGTILLGSTNDVYSYTLDTRHSDLRNAVNAAEAAGKINSAQANQLRADLSAIATNEINAQSDRLFTFDESLAIARDLDRVNTNLATLLSVQPFGQLVAMENGGVARIYVTTPQRNSTTTSTRTVTVTSSQPSSGAVFSVLNNRRFELDKLIGDAKLRGALVGNRAIDLQAKSDHVRLLMLDREGVLNQQQALKIAGELDALDAEVAAALNTSRLTPLTVVDTTSGTQRIVNDQFGNVIAITEAGPDVFVKTLEGRRLELEASIAAQQAAGSLAAEQARNLRAELDRVAQLQARENATGFTYVNALPLAMTLDYVGQELVHVVPSTTYVPLIDGHRFVVIGGRVVMLDDVMVRRAELESKISRMLATSKISSRQAAMLRSDLSKIATVERQMRFRGALTFADSRNLYNRFDKVGSRLDGFIASVNSAN